LLAAAITRSSLTASLMLLALGVAVAGPFEDALAAYERSDYATALRLFRPLANQGIAKAQYNLGVMYANGQGLPLRDLHRCPCVTAHHRDTARSFKPSRTAAV